jgi:hypothetical protein
MQKKRESYEKPVVRKIKLTAPEAMSTPCNASGGGSNNCYCEHHWHHRRHRSWNWWHWTSDCKEAGS